MAKCEQFLRHPVNASCKCFLLLRSREVVCECGRAGADSAGEWWHPGEEGGVISDIMSLVCHPAMAGGGRGVFPNPAREHDLHSAQTWRGLGASRGGHCQPRWVRQTFTCTEIVEFVNFCIDSLGKLHKCSYQNWGTLKHTLYFYFIYKCCHLFYLQSCQLSRKLFVRPSQHSDCRRKFHLGK